MGNKILRLKRLIPQDGKIFIMPIDHGVTMGMLPGINQYTTFLPKISELGIDALVVHKGIAMNAISLNASEKWKYFLHLSASANLSDTNKKVLVTDVEEALELGMDAVSLHINIDEENENQMLRDFGFVSKQCQKWGMPLMAMIYCKKSKNGQLKAHHLVRIAEELGADLVKISSSFELSEYNEIMKYSHIPVVVAGGEYTSDKHQLIRKFASLIEMGISGIAMGRNIFESQNYHATVTAFAKLLHNRISADEAIEIYDDFTHELKEVSI